MPARFASPDRTATIHQRLRLAPFGPPSRRDGYHLVAFWRAPLTENTSRMDRMAAIGGSARTIAPANVWARYRHVQGPEGHVRAGGRAHRRTRARRGRQAHGDACRGAQARLPRRLGPAQGQPAEPTLGR